ncbi:BglG family transcription antiterminator [Geomicrobium sediminis]|uniref:Transcriptional antiterminator/mannitol/fructose-specific phosphotransferase system IIA component (Ntr-type) n=1 Tax=Geomicrobium sediminis TaxID=1347788 RepID=A0ABS2P7D7_9BACL|nr:transcriptional antiterminator/mannitol/fructose-specific phosphotransferase system IIA component (Ntr-type) [Geomicrobium sediminis]
MVLDQRRIAILSYLSRATTTVSIPELANALGVSKRTLYYDFNEIDHWLMHHHLSPIQRNYNKGLFLETLTKERLPSLLTLKRQWDYRFTQVERHYVISAYLLLHDGFVSSNELSELVQVSRGTLFKDLAVITEKLDAFDVSLNYSKQIGYELKGSDQSLWRVIHQLIQIVIENEHDEVIQMLLNQCNQDVDDAEVMIREEIGKLEQQLDLSFNEQVTLSLLLHILMLYKRPLNNLWVDREEQEVLLQSQAFGAVDQLNERLSSKGFRRFTRLECVVLTIRILGSRVTDGLASFTKDERSDIDVVTTEIIEQFEAHSGVRFREKERLQKNLVAHIKPAYYRLKYNEPLDHRYLPLIEHQLKEVYTLTEQALEPLERYVNRTIPSEEVALIAMHFGGWIHRKVDRRSKAYRAVVICENGIAASSMLFAQLEGLLPDVEILDFLPVRAFSEYEQDIDFAFSTTYIHTSTVPIIYVPAILGDSEKAHVLRELQRFMDPDRLKQSDFESVIGIIEQHATIHDHDALRRQIEPYFRPTRSRLEVHKPMLHELVTEDMITVKPSVTSWQESIRIAAEPLLEKKYIHQEYIDAMIANVVTNGPYIVIAPNIAMPHARPEEGVVQLGMSILKTDEPVHFSEEEKHDARIIIVLAAVDNETHLKALSQLSELLSEEENTEEILASTTVSEIAHVIQNHNKGEF